MKRIFNISNRVDIPEPGKATTGGLDEAIADAPEGYEVVRFGWSGNIVDKDAYNEEDIIRTVKRGNITYITYDMTKEDVDGFYNGTSNSFLWPLFHYRVDIAVPGFNEEDNLVYDKVNRAIAERAKSFIESDDIVIAHDYHLIKIGKYLTSGKNPIGNPLGHFLHIPTPNADLIEGLEDRTQQRFVYDLMQHMHHYDFVGLQSQRDLVSLHTLIGETAQPQRTDLFQTQTFKRIPNNRGTHTQFGAFPVAGNVGKYSEIAKAWVGRSEVSSFIKMHTPDNQIDGMSVERLDYSKGLVAKARGVGRWMHEFGKSGEKMHLLQIAPKNRTDVRAYQDEALRVDTSFQDLNEMFGRISDLYTNPVPRPVHLGMARQSKFGLVLPLRDGFNLYGLEYMAAQEGREDPGVLVLSKFVGAAPVLNGAVIAVDPRLPEDVALGIQVARTMGKSERQDMLGQGLEIQKTHTNERWQKCMIAAILESAGKRMRAGTSVPQSVIQPPQP